MRLPVHVISGFLGSGKTTAILSYLRRKAGKEKIAVLVNDFGAVDIDGARMSGELGDGVSVVDVPGGCICCTAGVNLYAGLRQLLDQVKPDRIVIEPTGLARPAELVDLIRGSDLAERLEIRPVITMINPARQFRPPLSKITITSEQADAADVLVANFADKCRDDDLERFYGWAGGFYPPKLKVLTTTFGELPDEAFEWPAGQEAAQPIVEHKLTDKSHRHETHGHHAAHEPHSHPDGITQAAGKAGFLGRAWCWSADVVFDHARLEAFFTRLYSGAVPGVVRAKGVFRTERGWEGVEVAGSGGETAGATLEIRSSQHRRDSRVDIILYHQPPEAFAALEQGLQGARKL